MSDLNAGPPPTSWPVGCIHRAIEAGIIGSETEVIVGFEHDVEPASTRSLCERIGRLVALVCSLPSRLDAGSIESFAMRVGVPLHEAAALASCSRVVHHDGFARADVLQTAAGFRVLEINMGGTVGGLTHSSMPALFGVDQPGNPLDSWARHIARRVGDHPGRGIIVDGTGMKRPSPWPRYASAMTQALRRAGLDCAGVGIPADLTWEGSALKHEQELISWIYPIWFPWHVHENSDAFASLLAAIDAGSIALAVDPGSYALSSKSSLALLHRLADDGALDPLDTGLIRELIPATHIVEPSFLPELIANQEAWVLKPSMGYGGIDVVIGDETGASEWRALAERIAADGAGRYIAQARCCATVSRTHVYSASGGMRSYDARAVWGFYVADGVQCGDPILRAQAATGSAVINFATGAAIGPLPWLAPPTAARASH